MFILVIMMGLRNPMLGNPTNIAYIINTTVKLAN